MSGGAPVPMIVAEKILCIADLKEAGSKKLPISARGESKLLLIFGSMAERVVRACNASAICSEECSSSTNAAF
jgi:hypothetical protein